MGRFLIPERTGFFFFQKFRDCSLKVKANFTLHLDSLDLNPIEKTWDYIRRNITQRRPFPITKESTEKAWKEKWMAIPVEVTNSYNQLHRAD